MTRQKVWTYRVRRRGEHRGESITFCFQGREYMTTEWYPPWQNKEQRLNAACIVGDLNAAFRARNQGARAL
jgi:hypothetical protein